MIVRISVLAAVSALLALPSTVQVCQVGGVAVTCNLQGNATPGMAPDTTDAYVLNLPDLTNDFGAVFVTGITSLLKDTSATFSAYVPGAGTNGANAGLAPYMYFTVNPYGSNLAPGGDPYALVIVADSGYTSTNDAWYTDGINSASTVHIVLGNGWTAADAGITNPDWLGCCSNLPTLGDLLNVVIPANGLNAAETWGDTNIYKLRVYAGDWNTTGSYVAYVGNIDVVTPEPGSMALMALGFAGFAAYRRLRRA